MPPVGWQDSRGIGGSFAVESAAAFAWNWWQAYSGISGSVRVEQVAALAWNRWQDSPGIGGSFGLEYAGCPHPHFNFPSGESGEESCAAVIRRPEEYSWRVSNNRNDVQLFWIENTKYELNPGESMGFTSKVGTYANNGCGGGTHYNEPTIEFDRYANDGQYTHHQFTVDVTRYQGFVFWQDGNIVKFSSEEPR